MLSMGSSSKAVVAEMMISPRARPFFMIEARYISLLPFLHSDACWMAMGMRRYAWIMAGVV